MALKNKKGIGGGKRPSGWLVLAFAAGMIGGILLSMTLGYGRTLKTDTVLLPVSSRSLPAASPSPAERMNINTAALEDWDNLPGIGPALAQTIVDFREANGAFHFVEELMDVPGIGEKKLEDIRDLIFCP